MGHGIDNVCGVHAIDTVTTTSTKERTHMNADNEAVTKVVGSRNGTRDLYVKAIPESIWVRARCNATRSGLSFKEYVIRILGTCQPIPNTDPAVHSG